MKPSVTSDKRVKNALLLVICGPFACGKNSVIDELMKTGRFEKCTSVTTRPIGPGEIDGVDYFFVSPERFIYLRDEKRAFLETAEVHGNLYGTLKQSVEGALSSGQSVIVHIDMQGVETLIRYGSDLIASSLLTVYLEADLSTLIRRANKRARGITRQDFAKRIESFHREEAMKHLCNYRIPNPDGKLAETVEKIKQIVERRMIEIDYDR